MCYLIVLVSIKRKKNLKIKSQVPHILRKSIQSPSYVSFVIQMCDYGHMLDNS